MDNSIIDLSLTNPISFLFILSAFILLYLKTRTPAYPQSILQRDW